MAAISHADRDRIGDELNDLASEIGGNVNGEAAIQTKRDCALSVGAVLRLKEWHRETIDDDFEVIERTDGPNVTVAAMVRELAVVRRHYGTLLGDLGARDRRRRCSSAMEAAMEAAMQSRCMRQPT